MSAANIDGARLKPASPSGINPAIDRQTAAALNPMINSVSAQDTLEGLSVLIGELGHLVTFAANDRHPLDITCIYMVFAAIASALDYEAGGAWPEPEKPS